MKRKLSSPFKIKEGLIVAIDGPSGAGKSTVSRQLAEALGGLLLDTGAMYRAVAYYALKDGVSEDADIVSIAKRLEFLPDLENQTLLVGGEQLGLKLRTPQVSQNASLVSRIRKVREIPTRRQRTLAKKWSKKFPVVVEGRDIGTVVFPNVPCKFYVTADAEVRALRRFQQLKKQGAKGVTLKQVLKENDQRDLQDSTRKVAPLRCPEDAVVVDTSSMGVTQVVKFMRDHIRGRMTLPNMQKN